MSTRETTATTTVVGPLVEAEDALHYVFKVDSELSESLGVEVPALCGVWDYFEGGQASDDEGGEPRPVCRRCQELHDAAAMG